MKHEYFRGLASDDVKFRLDRVHEFATAILDLLGLDPTVINAVDVGAGKGIWSHMLVARSLRSVSVVEPNDTCVARDRDLEKRDDRLAKKLGRGNGSAEWLD